jgi:hypothetical protein
MPVVVVAAEPFREISRMTLFRTFFSRFAAMIGIRILSTIVPAYNGMQRKVK